MKAFFLLRKWTVLPVWLSVYDFVTIFQLPSRVSYPLPAMALTRSKIMSLFSMASRAPNQSLGPMSEKEIVEAWAGNLGIALVPCEVGRVHRLRRFWPGKKWPTIVKFANYKNKENILGRSGSLEENKFSVLRDYSAAVPVARNKLVEYRRPLNATFKLRFNKLLLGSRCFVHYAR